MKVFYMLMTKTFLICKSMSTRTNEMHDIISENMAEIFEIFVKIIITSF